MGEVVGRSKQQGCKRLTSPMVLEIALEVAWCGGRASVVSYWGTMVLLTATLMTGPSGLLTGQGQYMVGKMSKTGTDPRLSWQYSRAVINGG